MSMPLPTFRYHPDPLATGSVVESDAECEICCAIRGYRYAGPTFSQIIDEVEATVCPWCIDDGSAAESLEITFAEPEGWDDDVPPDVIDEVCQRTPGFHTASRPHWLDHHGDAAEFLGRLDHTALTLRGPDAVHAAKLAGAVEDTVVILFRCVDCNEFLAYVDHA